VVVQKQVGQTVVQLPYVRQREAVDVPDQPEREQPEVLIVARLGPQRPGQGHHAVLDRHDDVLGVGVVPGRRSDGPTGAKAG
jgi:hypothetical protein